MLNFKRVMKAYTERYAPIMEKYGYVDYNLGEGAGYYYMDNKNNAGVYMNTLILMIQSPEGEVIYVPLYKLIQVFPFEMSDYYYTILYVDNEGPAAINNSKSKWYDMLSSSRNNMSTITADYYKFLDAKISWYLKN